MNSGTDDLGLAAETDGASKYTELIKLTMRTSIILTYLHSMPVPTGTGQTKGLKRSCQGSLTKPQSRFLDKKTTYSHDGVVFLERDRILMWVSGFQDLAIVNGSFIIVYMAFQVEVGGIQH